MKRFTLLILAALWLAASPVWAVLVTQESQVQAKSVGNPSPDSVLGNNPPLDHITDYIFSSGSLFTNSTNIGGDGLARDLRTVGILQLNDMRQQGGFAFNAIRTPDADEHRIFALFGVQGRVFEQDNAKFTEGWMGFYSHSGNPNPNDPTTWDPAGADMSFITEYVLKEQFLRQGAAPLPDVQPDGPVESVIPGPDGENVFLLPDQNNVSGVNTAIGQLGDGAFVFIENPEEPNDPFIDTSYFDSLTGDPHLPSDMPGLIPIPTGQTKNGLPLFVEGLLVETGQRILAKQPTLTAAQLDVLNSIGNTAFGDDWASGLGEGPDTHFDNLIPTMTGDFVAFVDANAFPLAQYVVPEPSTVAAWGFGWLLIGGWGAVRRRRQRRS